MRNAEDREDNPKNETNPSEEYQCLRIFCILKHRENLAYPKGDGKTHDELPNILVSQVHLSLLSANAMVVV
ncbi:MAG: hypothetical protein E6P95_04160 [Candidatus Moraniibacteriota bacterium]|nr:MAG: hypothetical protein E6P95_04160 [Candidatus Moranbacteria bacterium]